MRGFSFLAILIFFLDKKETKNQEENMLPRSLCVLWLCH